MARHLVGLQAQENLPPYLSLAARLERRSTPATSRRASRTARWSGSSSCAAPCTCWPPTTRWSCGTGPPRSTSARSGSARTSEPPATSTARRSWPRCRRSWPTEPLPQKAIGAALAERFPDHAATQLGQLARSAAPLVQVPAARHLEGRPAAWSTSTSTAGSAGRLVEPDVEEIVRRYLRAFGPAIGGRRHGVVRGDPARSGAPGHGRPGHARGRERQAALRRPRGRARRRGRAGAGAAARRLRQRLARRTPGATGSPTPRRGPPGWPRTARAPTRLFVDGWLIGLWRPEDGRVEVLQTLRPLTPREQAELDEEIARVEELLAR